MGISGCFELDFQWELGGKSRGKIEKTCSLAWKGVSLKVQSRKVQRLELSSTMYQENKKDTLRTFQGKITPMACSKVQKFYSDYTGLSANHLLMFSHQGSATKEATVATVHKGLDTTHTSSRLWHCPPGAGFAGMQKTKVSYRVLEASTEISKESLRVQSVCGIFGVPASSTDRMMHETVKLKVKLQWRPQEVTDDRIWSDCWGRPP